MHAKWLVFALFPLACASLGSIPADPSRPVPDYWQGSELRFEDRVYSPTVRTVQLYKEGFELAPPVIELNGSEGLILRFDDLAADPQSLSYTLVHCDAQWQPTDLPQAQYIEGTLADYLPQARQSFNTLQPFLQYEVRIPNDMMRPTRSGNYLLKVYRDTDPEDLVLTRRLLVYEQQAEVEARIQAPRRVDLIDVAQQVDLTVRHPRLNVQDPFTEIHVAMLQNMRWDDLRSGFKPRYLRGSELVYDFPEQGLFMGGNEYRNFDLKDLRFTTGRIVRIEPGDSPGPYHAYLEAEPRRNIRVYFDQPDLNGRFFVRNDMFDGDPLGTDYVYVHFKLPMSAPLGTDVHVYGAFSDWRLEPWTRMTWNADRQAYMATLLLKQGFYDFAFVTPSNAGSDVPGPVDFTAAEGSHYQTENDYLVLVYFSDRMQRLDRLVGVQFLNSRR